MNANDAIQDAINRLHNAGIAFKDITAKVVDYSHIGYGRAVIVSVQGVNTTRNAMSSAFNGLKLPSKGGYCCFY